MVGSRLVVEEVVEGRAVERLVGWLVGWRWEELKTVVDPLVGWLVDVPFPLIKPPRIRTKGREERGDNMPPFPPSPSTFDVVLVREEVGEEGRGRRR